jgi:hypothetical protein
MRMKIFQIAVAMAALGLGLSIPTLAADAQTSSQSQGATMNQPGASGGRGQTGKPDQSQADTTKRGSDQQSSQSDTSSTGAASQSPVTMQQPKGNSGVSGTSPI